MTNLHRAALDARMRPIDWLALLVVMCIIGGLAGAGLAGL